MYSFVKKLKNIHWLQILTSPEIENYLMEDETPPSALSRSTMNYRIFSDKAEFM